MASTIRSFEISRFLVQILGSRPTGLGELPELITSIDRGLAQCRGAELPAAGAPSSSAAFAKTELASDIGSPIGATPVDIAPADIAPAYIAPAGAAPGEASPAGDLPTGVVTDADLDAVATSGGPARAAPKRRGRPARSPQIAERVEDTAPEPAAAPLPAPRLVRRGSMPAVDAAVRTPVADTSGVLRGVVRWFDPKTRKGALRLTGIGGDIGFDGRIMEQSGIARLFKGQEIEAQIADQKGEPHLVLLRVPARDVEPERAGLRDGAHRSRSLVIEMKRDSLRRAAARVEAEQLLSAVGRNKDSRRNFP